jgi:hypothetical protein
MALSIRFATNPKYPILTANSRSYPTNGALVIDVPFNDGGAIDSVMATRLFAVGATADRPAYNPDIGGVAAPVMYDTTVGGVIFWVPGSYPAKWVGIDGVAV